MPLTLTDLSLLIELTEKELIHFHDLIDNDKDEFAVDEAAELAMQAGITAGNLRELYEENWEDGCNYPGYSELIESFKF